MKNVLVLGGGQMGSIIAKDLSKNYKVTIADKNPIDLQFDITSASYEEINSLFKQYAVIVGALPSHLGHIPLMIAANNSQHKYVDLSFSKENPEYLFQNAWINLSTIFYDCGVSPGLSNLIAGKFNQAYKPKSIKIFVGGISQDPKAPYGHVNTWCVEDLSEEYTRPARFILKSREEIINPLNDEYWVETEIEELGTLEAFITDGLRSLLKLKGPENIVEFTLRRPKHLNAVKKLIKNNQFVKEIKSKCNKGRDILVLKVTCDYMTISMIDKATRDVSAMARTTAYSCSAFAQLLLEDLWKTPGIYAPEKIGLNTECYEFIFDKLREHDIKFNYSEKSII